MRDHAAAPEPSPRSGRRPQLNEVMFGSNPTPDSRWTQITGAQADIATVGYVEDGHWSLSCNQDRIGPGTVAIRPFRCRRPAAARWVHGLYRRPRGMRRAQRGRWH